MCCVLIELYLDPFVTGHAVQSFPILKDPGFNIKLANLAKQIQIVEIREWHYIKQLNKKLSREATELVAKQVVDQAALKAAQSAAFEAALLEESSASDLPTEGDQTGRDDSNMEENDSIEEAIVAETKANPVDLEHGGSRRGSVLNDPTIAKSPTMETEIASKMGVDVTTLAPPPSSALGASSILPIILDIDDDEDVELYITETAPTETFLYGTFELSTSKRKRLQVSLYN